VKSATLVLIFILLAVNAGVVQAVNPIRLVRQPLSNGEAIKLNEQAQEQMKKDDLTGAARTIQLAMQKDPTPTGANVSAFGHPDSGISAH